MNDVCRDLLPVRVQSMTYEAEDILSFELVGLDRQELPAFLAGAHIDVHIKHGVIRQYSLCNSPAERFRYVIAVLHEPAGRGGSGALHREVRLGEILKVSPPRNHFPLATNATRHILIAGGIGVTPMMAMLAQLRQEGADFKLFYCTRTPQKTAFLDRLSPLVATGRVQIHHDGGDPRRSLDFSAILPAFTPGTHLYYCGPPAFMAAVRDAVAHWRHENVHCEYFAAPEQAPCATENRPFQIKLARTSVILNVPQDRSIVETLRTHGVHVETACESGYCGTCLTRYLEGEPEHRDVVLDEQDRREFVLICCARSKSPQLVLDL